MTREIIGDVEYEFPIGNKEREQEIYYLKRALSGDKAAMDIFMGGEDVKWLFIGKETPIWAKFWVEEGKLKSVVKES